MWLVTDTVKGCLAGHHWHESLNWGASSYHVEQWTRQWLLFLCQCGGNQSTTRRRYYCWQGDFTLCYTIFTIHSFVNLMILPCMLSNCKSTNQHKINASLRGKVLDASRCRHEIDMDRMTSRRSLFIYYIYFEQIISQHLTEKRVSYIWKFSIIVNDCVLDHFTIGSAHITDDETMAMQSTCVLSLKSWPETNHRTTYKAKTFSLSSHLEIILKLPSLANGTQWFMAI